MNTRHYILGIALFFFPSLSFAQPTDGETPNDSAIVPPIKLERTEMPNNDLLPDGQANTPPEELSNKDIKRIRAKMAYGKGRQLAKQKKYSEARFYFEQALGYIRLPIVLYAAAQCRKDLGHDIEALLLFFEAVKPNINVAPNDYLSNSQQAAAFEIMEELLQRFVQVEFTEPKGDRITRIQIDGEDLTTIHIEASQKNEETTVQSGSDVLRRNEVTFDHIIGLTENRLANLKKTDPNLSVLKSTLQKEFWIKPNTYSFEIELHSGRTIFLKNLSVMARTNQVDLKRKDWPARVIIEEIPADTRIVFHDLTHRTIPLDRKYTDRERDVEIANLPSGQYDLVATRKGFRDIKKNIILHVGQKEPIYLDFEQKPFYRKWPFWLGAGLVSAAIVGISVALVRSRQEDPPGSGTVTFSVVQR
ncbi:MAG: hypothetical protein JXR76_00525 [Deltaproteobacteria bacterium]|nr:hypothetical protein [Deltaproteobacteria bacterium]